MKTMYTQHTIGKAKYCLSFHDGISTHKDGSPFYGIKLFSNKKMLQKTIKHMTQEGYHHV